MTLPNFLIIGAQKSGTSWLAANLRQHPDVFMPKDEIHYFDKSYNFRQGISWYKQHFTGVENQTAIGEKTPDYLWANGKGVEGHLPNVHQNIYETLPDIKLILVLRNPVYRAISAANHIIRSGRVSPLHNIDDLLLGHKQYLLEGHGVIDYGRYYRQIQAYQDYFAFNQMLILIFEEDIIQNPHIGLKKVCDFIGVDSSFEWQKTKEKINRNNSSQLGLILSYYFPLTKKVVRQIDQYLPTNKVRQPSEMVINKLSKVYADENEKLFDLLGRRITLWNS